MICWGNNNGLMILYVGVVLFLMFSLSFWIVYSLWILCFSLACQSFIFSFFPFKISNLVLFCILFYNIHLIVYSMINNSLLLFSLDLICNFLIPYLITFFFIKNWSLLLFTFLLELPLLLLFSVHGSQIIVSTKQGK